MKNNQHKARLAMLFLMILAILLTACGSAATATPEATIALPTNTIAATSTEEPTVAATQRPDARDAAVAWTKAALSMDAKESPTAIIDRICGMASEYGCQSVQSWDMASAYARYPDLKTQPVIQSTRLLYSGVMSDGTEYEVWEVIGEQSNPPLEKMKNFNRYPTFIWSSIHQRWEYFYSPDGPTTKSLSLCGQFVEYAADGHAYGTDAEWQAVYSQCQTATPLPPTPFVPVTPVFTPMP